MMQKKNRNTLTCFLIALFIGLTFLVYTNNSSGMLGLVKGLELKSYNNRLNTSLAVRNLFQFNLYTPQTVVILIDDETGEHMGDLFKDKYLKRDTYAHLIEQINARGASVIGLDIMFTKDQSPDDPDNKLLLDTINKHKNVVLASRLTERANVTGQRLVKSFAGSMPDNSSGIANVIPDSDDTIRHFRLFFPFKSFDFQNMIEKDTQIDSFATAIIRKHKPGASFAKFETFPDKEYFINYLSRNNSQRPTMALYELFDRQVFESVDFKDKIVLVGNSMNTFHDIFHVPVKTKASVNTDFDEYGMPGVEIHANIVDSIINNAVITKLPFLWQLLVVMFLCCLSGGLYGLNKGLNRSLLTFFGIIIFYLVYSYILFTCFNFVVVTVYPVIQLCFIAMVCWLYLYFAENKQKLHIYNSFKKYVSPEVARLAAEDVNNLSSRKQYICILFSDIAGFTTITERTDSRTLSDMLNQYLTRMGKIIFSMDGTLDKYIGDAVMAFWGAPVQIDIPELKACRAALMMLRDTETLNEEFIKGNLPAFKVRIGINSDEVIVGNLGGDLFNYTAIGDGVNLAARLEGVNKVFDTSIIISHSTYEKVKDIMTCRLLADIKVKGKTQSVLIYELVGEKAGFSEEKQLKIESFSSAIQAFKAQNWQKAATIFSNYLNYKSEDQTSKMYLDEINRLKEEGIPEGWDGSITLKEK